MRKPLPTAVRESPKVPFSELDTTAIARSLSQIADRKGDLAEVFFERREEVVVPPADRAPGILTIQEQGFAVRLVRGGKTWLAAHDEIRKGLLGEALRQAARVVPTTPYPEPAIKMAEMQLPTASAELLDFPRRVTRAIRQRLAAFPLLLTVRSHRRWIRVVRPQLSPDPESEHFFSCEAELPWGRWGTLLSKLDEDAAEKVAKSLTALFRAREAETAMTGRYPIVLGSSACAVFLHEVVAHALETDTLVLGGRVEGALGAELGGKLLNVLDDPAGAPEGVKRKSDDEGVPVERRWLLREGVVEQPLADQVAAHASIDLVPGAGRRSHRHEAPVPRSFHLELLPGEDGLDDLLADLRQGLYLPEVSRGRLDPLTGEFELEAPYCQMVIEGSLGDLAGPCRLVGRVADLLSSVNGVGSEVESAGAGWCAKGGVRLPVWATTPAIRLEIAEVEP